MNPTKAPDPANTKADHYLDITGLVCPMTFVKTKLLLESMVPGETCEVRLKGAEPLENVPRSATELGHAIVSLATENEGETGADAIHRLVIQKAQN